MSSDIIASVHALAEKALELSNKGHVLRAAENYGRAAEAARALGADNFATAFLQLQQGTMLMIYVGSSPNATADPRVRAARTSEFIALLSGAVEALERRRVADTLLEGKCSAAEEAWRADELQR